MASHERAKYTMTTEELQENGVGSIVPPSTTGALVDKYKSLSKARVIKDVEGCPHTWMKMEVRERSFSHLYLCGHYEQVVMMVGYSRSFPKTSTTTSYYYYITTTVTTATTGVRRVMDERDHGLLHLLHHPYHPYH